MDWMKIMKQGDPADPSVRLLLLLEEMREQAQKTQAEFAQLRTEIWGTYDLPGLIPKLTEQLRQFHSARDNRTVADADRWHEVFKLAYEQQMIRYTGMSVDSEQSARIARNVADIAYPPPPAAEPKPEGP